MAYFPSFPEFMLILGASCFMGFGVLCFMADRIFPNNA